VSHTQLLNRAGYSPLGATGDPLQMGYKRRDLGFGGDLGEGERLLEAARRH
jgi:hypothetical protein